METENAFWYLSTIAQVCAALVGLILIAFVFFLDQLRRFRLDYRGARAYGLMSRIFGVRALPYLLVFSILATFTVFIGMMTVLKAVDGIGFVGNEPDSDLQAAISEVSSMFVIFIVMAILISIMLLIGGCNLLTKRLEDDERAAGGRGVVARELKDDSKKQSQEFMERNTIIRRIRSRKKRGPGNNTHKRDENS